MQSYSIQLGVANYDQNVSLPDITARMRATLAQLSSLSPRLGRWRRDDFALNAPPYTAADESLFEEWGAEQLPGLRDGEIGIYSALAFSGPERFDDALQFSAVFAVDPHSRSAFSIAGPAAPTHPDRALRYDECVAAARELVRIWTPLWATVYPASTATRLQRLSSGVWIGRWIYLAQTINGLPDVRVEGWSRSACAEGPEGVILEHLGGPPDEAAAQRLRDAAGA